MTRSMRIIGLGQAFAGDDGVGLAVLRALRAERLPDFVELAEVADPGALVELLASDAAIVLVDAILGQPAGELAELSPKTLADRAPGRLSSHGVSVPQAIGLARALAQSSTPPTIQIIAISIARPDRCAQGLSPEVAAAVPRAVQRVLARVREHTSVEGTQPA